MIMSTPFPPVEGIGYYVYNLSKELIECGNEVTVITRGHFTKQKMEFEGIEVIEAPFLPLIPFHVHIFGLYLNRFLHSREQEFDIIHIHTPSSPAMNTSLPIVTTFHTSILEETRFVKAKDIRRLVFKTLSMTVGSSLSRKLISKSDMVMTVSKSVAEEIRKYYDFEGVRVVGNGIDLTSIPPPNMKESGDYLLYVGRIGHLKGIPPLLDAMRIVNESDENVKLLLAGKGELLSWAIQKAREYEIENCVEFLGHIGNRVTLNTLYQNAKIFILPSSYEGLPTVLLEAMAFGLPVIASDIPSVREVITDELNGLLVTPNSSYELSEAIKRLLYDEETRRRLGTNARRTVEENYSWDIVARRILDVYQEALD